MHSAFDLLRTNLLSPLVLAFLLGIFARVIRSDLSIPKDLYTSLSIYLLLALGLKGGVELAETEFAAIAMPALATLFLGVLTPISAFLLLRHAGRFRAIDAAAMAAHYGSVSAVTFIAANQFAIDLGQPPEGYMPTLLTLLESPGIHIGLALGAIHRTTRVREGEAQASSVWHEILTARSMVLLVGGLVIGWLIGAKGFAPVKPFFETGFKGALVLFLLELGLLAGSRLTDLRAAGPRLVILALVIPLLHGMIGVWLAHLSGLSVGGSAVLGAMAASASYIAAPPAVRATLPEANPALYLTASLALTFPFNLVAGIPLFFELAIRLGGSAH